MFWPRLLVLLTYIVLVFYVDISSSNRRKPYINSATLPANGTKKVCRSVTLHVNFIHDSRCPVDVQCIWAGRADVQLLLSKKRASSTVNLTISASPGTFENSARVTLNAASYGVTLQDVVPYPRIGGPPGKAVIQVECP